VTSRFIIIDLRDNVATAVDLLARGEALEAPGPGGTVLVNLNTDVPFGHKFALRAIAMGEQVIKYGEVIGVATRPIGPGDHVHVHNVDGVRGRGDIT
jgi:altronate dehydratase small subunit